MRKNNKFKHTDNLECAWLTEKNKILFCFYSKEYKNPVLVKGYCAADYEGEAGLIFFKHFC